MQAKDQQSTVCKRPVIQAGPYPFLLSAAILASRIKDVFDETTRDRIAHQRL